MLLQLLKDRGLSQEEFAVLVRQTPPRISVIARDLKPPNWRRADGWADALKLRGKRRQDFLDAMHVASASPRVQALVRRLQRRQLPGKLPAKTK